MTSTEMLAVVRTLLEESTAGFWTDAEVYTALGDGQYDVLDNLFSTYKKIEQVNPNVPLFDVLRPLVTVVENLSFGTTGTSTVTLPADFFQDLNVEYIDSGSTLAPAFKRALNSTHRFNQANTYMASSQSQYFYWTDATNLNFGTVVSGTGAYRLTYLKKPAAISAIVNPTLGFQAHEAVCYYAFARLLLKDEKFQEANAAFMLYLKKLPDLYY